MKLATIINEVCKTEESELIFAAAIWHSFVRWKEKINEKICTTEQLELEKETILYLNAMTDVLEKNFAIDEVKFYN